MSPPKRAALLLPLGMALGPYGLNILSAAVISSLTPALPVAVACVGVLAGLRLDFRPPGIRAACVASLLDGGLTFALVVAGIVGTARLLGGQGAPPWLLAILLGLCASVSSTADAPVRTSTPWARLIDVENLVTIVLGGLVLALFPEKSLGVAAWMTAQMGVIAVVIAIGAWLLVAQTGSDNEQRVFAVGALLLLGGVAEYLSLSALFAGLVAGACWNAAGGAARERLTRDMRYVQHPLIVLLLLFAGARLRFPAEIAAFAAAYVICRTAGKLVGTSIARRQLPSAQPDYADLYLLPAGTIAVGFAVNTLLAGGAASAEMLLAVVALGAIASDLLSLAYQPREAA